MVQAQGFAAGLGEGAGLSLAPLKLSQCRDLPSSTQTLRHWGPAKCIPSQGPSPHVPAHLGAEGGVLGQTGSFLHCLKGL